MKDRVVYDEQMYDRDCTAQQVLIEQGRAYAQTEYEAGQLDDWIQDNADPSDTFKIAHATLQWLDYFLAGKYETMEDALTGLNTSLSNVPLAIKDFRATIEGVIEEKAKMIAEDL
jgi:hypothetical protein